MTRDEALKLADSKFWEHLSLFEIAEFQLQEPLLCMPFGIFHEAVEKSLGRPVYTHEFVDMKSLLAELRKERPPKTVKEIISMIPKEKLVLVIK